jgi:hypothetical protein
MTVGHQGLIPFGRRRRRNLIRTLLQQIALDYRPAQSRL